MIINNKYLNLLSCCSYISQHPFNITITNMSGNTYEIQYNNKINVSQLKQDIKKNFNIDKPFNLIDNELSVMLYVNDILSSDKNVSIVMIKETLFDVLDRMLKNNDYIFSSKKYGNYFKECNLIFNFNPSINLILKSNEISKLDLDIEINNITQIEVKFVHYFNNNKPYYSEYYYLLIHNNTIYSNDFLQKGERILQAYKTPINLIFIGNKSQKFDNYLLITTLTKKIKYIIKVDNKIVYCHPSQFEYILNQRYCKKIIYNYYDENDQFKKILKNLFLN